VPEEVKERKFYQKKRIKGGRKGGKEKKEAPRFIPQAAWLILARLHLFLRHLGLVERNRKEGKEKKKISEIKREEEKKRGKRR